MNIKYYREYVKKLIALMPYKVNIQRKVIVIDEWGQETSNTANIGVEEVFLCDRSSNRINMTIHDRGTIFKTSSARPPYALTTLDSKIKLGDVLNRKYVVTNINECLGICKNLEVDRVESGE